MELLLRIENFTILGFQAFSEAFDAVNANCQNLGEINYRSGTIFVRDILTHADYDKDKWK